jgi:hypothetical protein
MLKSRWIAHWYRPILVRDGVLIHFNQELIVSQEQLCTAIQLPQRDSNPKMEAIQRQIGLRR